ncbi:hypothetical protein [Leisingera aquaemixtae]|uniref:hypothetical protein n=1 Tax=Leisingera aquaemixtae TaxID=1396826 RepID=UPI0021A84AB4|nr:hypothetical protein [Leisingera aquaemixtae]
MRDLKQAEAELWETISEGTMAVVAARTALRLLPNTAFGKLSQNPALNLTHDFRQVLTQVVNLVKEPETTASTEQIALVRAALRGTIDVVDEFKHQAPYYAAKSAAAAIDAASRKHASAAQAATDAAHFAASAQQASKAADISEQVSSSIVDLAFKDRRVEQRKGLAECFAEPLLPSTGSHLVGFWKKIQTSKSGASTTFSFWREWYQGFLEGRPLDWELQRRVALIDDKIWDAGPEAVAPEIERIKAEMLSEKLPMAETIELNPETGKFRAIPIPVENAPYMSALLSQISDALEDCLGGHNGLSERSGDALKLNRVLTKYKDDPQNAELTLTRVAGSLRAQLHDSRELPDNEDNLALLNAVEEGVRGIRANHPEVAANREQLAQQAFKALAPEDKQVLEEALPVLTAISEAELAVDFAQDIPELINDARLPLPDGAPPLPGADAATRVFSRVSKMALLQEQYGKLTRKGAEWFDSDTRKTVQLAGLVGGGAIAAWVNFGPKLLELVQIGLRLLGVL